jgi:2-furoate---CoA ligase
MDLQHVLLATAERSPERPALAGPVTLTYAQLTDQALRLAAAFRDRGLGRGGRIATILPNGAAFTQVHVAATLLGACTVPLNTRYGQDELDYCIRDSGPALLVAAPEHLAAARSAARRETTVVSGGTGDAQHAGLDDLIGASGQATLTRVEPGDASVMLYTSGTTGRPKGVVRTHAMEFAATMSMVHHTRWTPDDTTLGAMPAYHTMGLHALLGMILFGGTYVPMAGFDADTAIDLILAHSISTACLIPTLYWRLVNSPRALEGLAPLRKLMAGGAPLTRELARRIREVIQPEVFVNWFGCTEIFSFSVETDPAARPGSVGQPTALTRMRVVRPDTEASRATPDEVVPAGQVGQVIVAASRQDDAFTGYFNRPDADRKALRDGWYFTGDLGRVDGDGRYWLAGRTDDAIITGGENVYPAEVEEALARCPDVAEVAVCGTPDPEWGQAVTAFVVLDSPENPQQAATAILDWARSHSQLAGFKRPRQVIAVEAIPKSAVGKTLRRELAAGDYIPLARAAAANAAGAGPEHGTRPPSTVTSPPPGNQDAHAAAP